MPSYNQRIYGRKRQRGLPDLRQIVTSQNDYNEDLYTKDINTPFRLPRLYGSEPSRAVSAASYSQREFLAPTPDTMIYAPTPEYLRMTGSPLKVPVKASFDYPRLTNAIVAPKTSFAFIRPSRSQMQSQSMSLKSSYVRPQTALSDTGSIHWALGSSKTVNFDRTGRSRHQGPFSRVFTKTCMAPQNWVKMKYGGTYAVS